MQTDTHKNKEYFMILAVLLFSLGFAFVYIFIFLFALYLIGHSSFGVKHNDREFMEIAFQEAEKSLQTGDPPIGAILVLDGKVIARGHSSTISLNDHRNHAEAIAINEAMKQLKIKKNFNEVQGALSLYTTSEPCALCEGFIVYKKIPRVIVGERHYDFRKFLGKILGFMAFKLKERGGILEHKHFALDRIHKANKGKSI